MTISEYYDLINDGTELEKRMLEIINSNIFSHNADYVLPGDMIVKIRNFTHKAVQAILEREVN